MIQPSLYVSLCLDHVRSIVEAIVDLIVGDLSRQRDLEEQPTDSGTVVDAPPKDEVLRAIWEHTRAVREASGASLPPAKRCTKAFLRKSVEKQVNEYLEAGPVFADDLDPLRWWVSEGARQYPDLCPFALSRLACPATTVQSERLFKHAKQTHTPERNRMTADTASKLLFCMFNLRYSDIPGPRSLRRQDLAVQVFEPEDGENSEIYDD